MHDAVSVSPKDSYARILQSFEELRAGMSVRIVLTSGYDSETRPHGSEECRRRGILASMVADLQHVGMHFFRTALSL